VRRRAMTSGHTITTETTDQRVRVVVGGETLADSTQAVVRHETGLRPRSSLPREHVRMDLLVGTDTATTCPFKGDARYWSVRVGDDQLDRPETPWSEIPHP
jgi:uncharacterized protein (DUF427 family)